MKSHDLIKYFASKFNNIHLRNKLLICYGSLIILIVFAIGLFSLKRIEGTVYTQTVESYNQTLVQFKINIENKLTIYDELINQIVTGKDLLYALSNQYDSPSDYSYEYANTISKSVEIKKKDKSVENAFILKNNNTLPESSNDLIDISNAFNTWWYKKYFAEANNYKSINDYIKLSKLKTWIVTNEDVLPKYNNTSVKTTSEFKASIIKPIIFDYKQLVGIYAIYINYAKIFSDNGNKLIENSVDDQICILDQQNNLVYNSCDAGVLQSSSLISEIGDKKKGEFEFNDNGNKRLVLFIKGEESGWTYIRQISNTVIFSNSKAIRDFSFLVGIAGIVISFVIAMVIANILAKRITKLSNSMKQVESLNLGIGVQVDGKDEIGELAQSYNHMTKKLNSLVKQLTASQQIQRESELKALQAQINPHFLYNTLATINWMAMGNLTGKIITMVDNLSTFYRLSLNKGREYLRIDEEIMLVKAYTDIQKTRMDDRINFYYDISDEIMDSYTLKLVLQPFIENAIIHGAEHKKKATNIIIKGYRLNENIIFEIIDDGVGMKTSNIPMAKPYSGGYGIRNVHEKIQLLYGNSFGVNIFSKVGIGTVATITIPNITVNPNITRQ